MAVPKEDEKEIPAENVDELKLAEELKAKEVEPIEGEIELDEDGNPKEAAELEAWELTGEEDDADKPEKTLKAKKKWKREREAKNEEVEALKAENAALKAAGSNSQPTELKRPNPDDFEDDDDYEDAKEKYLMQRIEINNAAGKTAKRQQTVIDNIKAGVDVHNERVTDFVEEKKINPDVYVAAETAFIGVIDEIFPGQGEQNADFFLSKLGAGSEKIPYFLGRNKTKLAEFKEILRDDASGIAAGIFLGSLNRKLRGTSTGKTKSKAPAPARTASGDTLVKSETASEKALKAKYDKAHKDGNGSLAFEIKMKAKREHKINTTEW